MLCQSCKRSGKHTFGSNGQPRWCRCRKRAGTFGPIVAAPGTILVWRFEAQSDADFREQCRLAGNAQRTALETLRSDKWVRCGKGYRELPRTSAKRRGLEAAYKKALAGLTALQAQCPHGDRSPYQPEYCGCCYAHVESNIEHHRHLVREGFFDAAAE